MKTLYNELKAYADSDYYGFHMPGHKRNRDITGISLPYEIDITEIEGFDDLHHPSGILLSSQRRAAELYKASETYFLVNGSTAGILSAILGCTRRGSKILMARNCHRSVYHAVYLNELEPMYIYPECNFEWEINGPVASEEVRSILQQNPEISAVIVTVPTYEGIISDIREIAKAAHEYEIPLIVDAAHGAHFGFHPYFPEHANMQGADVVINSIHKTLPALTQTALIHINGKYADRERIKNYLHMLQTSSPSYILMAGIDGCISWLEEHGRESFTAYAELLKNARKQLGNMKHLYLVETDDPSKFVISVKRTGLSGKELYFLLLEKYHLQMEMAGTAYVLGISSVGDSREGMDRFIQALMEIDEGLKSKKLQKSVNFCFPHMEQVFIPAEAEKRSRTASLVWNKSTGFASAEYAYLYPPGIPLIVPGEKISKEIIELLKYYKKSGFEIGGLRRDGEIKVLLKKK